MIVDDRGDAGPYSCQEDCTDLVLHARRTVFVMLIVSALVLTGVYVGDDYRTRLALEEAKIVRGLMKQWSSRLMENDRRQLPQGLAGNTVDKRAVSTFTLSLEQQTGPKPPRMVTCTLRVGGQQRYFVSETGDVQSLRVSLEGQIEIFHFTGPGKPHSRPWNLPHVPRNLNDFLVLWHMLDEHRTSARIALESLDANLRKATITDERELYQVIDVKSATASIPVEWEEPSMAPVEEYEHTKTARLDKSGNIIFREHLEWKGIVEEWKKAGFTTAGATTCVTEETVGAVRRYLVVFPVTVKKTSFSWTGAWLEEAVSGGYLTKETAVSMNNHARPGFGNAFDNLKKATRGLGSLELTALHDWLEVQLTEKRQNIEVMGLRFSGALLRVLGMFAIVLVQGYATLHLVEAAKRMKNNVGRDIGAFQAWVLLYDGLAAWIVTVLALIAPTVATAAVLIRLQDEGSVSFFGSFLSGIALYVSVLLMMWSIDRAWELRTTARRHRRAGDGISGSRDME